MATSRQLCGRRSAPTSLHLGARAALGCRFTREATGYRLCSRETRSAHNGILHPLHLAAAKEPRTLSAPRRAPARHRGRSGLTASLRARLAIRATDRCPGEHSPGLPGVRHNRTAQVQRDRIRGEPGEPLRGHVSVRQCIGGSRVHMQRVHKLSTFSERRRFSLRAILPRG
jgi:hypothetical protein